MVWRQQHTNAQMDSNSLPDLFPILFPIVHLLKFGIHPKLKLVLVSKTFFVKNLNELKQTPLILKNSDNPPAPKLY